MRYSHLMTAAVICAAIGIAGCNRVESEKPAGTNDLGNSNDVSQTISSAETQVAKDGWAIYSPPEQDFSVMAPENSVEVKIREEPKFGKLRRHVFGTNGARSFSVTIHTERTGALAGNSVEEVKADTSYILPGSLKDISIGDTPGVEFRVKGRSGESVFREYCPEDNSRTITLHVAKNLENGVTEDEVRLFLDSFKLLP